MPLDYYRNRDLASKASSIKGGQVIPINDDEGYEEMKYTNAEIADIIETFVDGTISKFGWDDFTSCPIQNPEQEKIRWECLLIHDNYPTQGAYCSEEGLKRLLEIANSLRSPTQSP